MSVPQLPWDWIGGGAIVLLLTAVWWLRGFPPLFGRRRRAPRDAAQPVSVEAVPAPHQDHPAYVRRELQDTMSEQSHQLKSLVKRVEALEAKIGELSAADSARRETARESGSEHTTGAYTDPFDSGSYGAASLRPAHGSNEAEWSPGPRDQAVEVRDGVLAVSNSLPPAAYVVAAGPGQGRVYLNAAVQLTEFSLPKWSAFFDLQGARPYAAYRTRRPAEVKWDEGTGRGELLSKGTAEAI